MKYFVASPWKNKDAVEALCAELKKRGFEVYSFLESGANLLTGQSVAEEITQFSTAVQNWDKDPNIKKIFDAEMQGLHESDVIILLQPAGHSSLLETGIGYGMGKEVVIIGDITHPEVFYLISKKLYPTTDAFLNDLPAKA